LLVSHRAEDKCDWRLAERVLKVSSRRFCARRIMRAIQKHAHVLLRIQAFEKFETTGMPGRL